MFALLLSVVGLCVTGLFFIYFQRRSLYPRFVVTLGGLVLADSPFYLLLSWAGFQLLSVLV